MSALEPDTDEADVDDLVGTIADAGPDDARTIVPTAQAEALIRRDVHGQSRPDTAAAIDDDLTVYAVDDRLRRARANTVAAAATVRRLLEADAIDDDAHDHLDAIRRLLSDSREDAVSAAESEPGTEPDHAGLDSDAAAWGRLMTLEATHEVTRGNGAVSITLDDADDHARETVHDVLDSLGLEAVDRTEYGTSGRETIRATHDTDGLEDVEAAESAAESDDVDEPDPEPDDTADRRNVLLLGDTPIPDRTDRLTDDDLDELAATVERTLAADLDDLENGEILGTLMLDGDTWSFNPAVDLAAHAGEDDGDQDGDESEDDDGYTCEDCGESFSSPGGLGGHRKYCPERPENDG